MNKPPMIQYTGENHESMFIFAQGGPGVLFREAEFLKVYNPDVSDQPSYRGHQRCYASDWLVKLDTQLVVMSDRAVKGLFPEDQSLSGVWVNKHEYLLALRWTGQNLNEIFAFAGTQKNCIYYKADSNDHAGDRLNVLRANYAEAVCFIGDWIVKDSKDESKDLFVLSEKVVELMFEPTGFEQRVRQADPDAKEPKEICSFCLADPFSTSTNQNPKMRCPVCASAYKGPSRIEEFQVLKDAGLVKALRT